MVCLEFCFYFVCVDILSAYMIVYYVRSWWPRRREEVTGAPGNRVNYLVVSQEHGCWQPCSGSLENVLNHWATSLVPVFDLALPLYREA